jgi:pantoate--beta-alanine ligase
VAKVIIAAGSNLGNRRQNIRQGLRLMNKSGVKIIKNSSYFKNPPAEETAGGEFLNAAVLAETNLEPEPLLALLHEIEKNSGRPQPHKPRKARCLDLDIIYYGNRVIEKPDLKIPHPRRLQRRFVMEPAAEAAPDFRDPILKKTLENISRKNMATVKKSTDLRERLNAVRKSGRKIGFVPTMGAIHEGHLALIRACRKAKLFCVISIFVNPTQFGPAEDYRKYPRNLEKDAKLAEKAGAGLIFAPGVKEMYPAGLQTSVKPAEWFSEELCGKYRPDHYRGVATVVLKLFNLVQPDKAYFGWKDAQQLIMIKMMARDLNFPIEIIGVPTVREPDGLAMSSRNIYLSPAERKAAPALYHTLLQIKNDCEKHKKSLKKTLKKASVCLKKNPFIKLQYLEAVDLSTLENAGKGIRLFPKDETLVAIAAFLGSTRLIDNIFVKM